MYENHMEYIDWASSYDTADISTRSKAKHDEWQKLLHCDLITVDGANIFELDMKIIKQKFR